jgi:M6 family metalloprotease-like protein
MAACNRRCRFPFNLFVGLSFLLFAISASEGTARAQPSSLPAAAGTAVDLEGDFVIIHEDFKHSGRYLYFLNTSSGQVPLHFNSKAPTNLLTGDHVRAHGTVGQNGTLILASGGSVTTTSPTTTSSGPLPNTFGAQSTLVILVNFQDAPTNQPYTVASAQSVVFGTSSSFFLENSYQQTWLIGKVVGWYTIPVSSTTCNITTIASDAQSAASAAGINLSAYARYVYAFPQNNACSFAGASFVGGSPSQSWINGTTVNGILDIHIVDHELGHALGLWHSHLLDCGTTATIGSSCGVVEYGDIIDTMGAYQPASPHYNAFQKDRLGWLNYGTSPSITTVTTPGTYVINAYELAGSGPNALKIPKSIDPTTGAKTWYYIEARRAVGFDAFLTNGTCEPCYTQNETNGVLFHIGTDGNGNSSDLLDMTPATPTENGWFDPSLVVGQSFQDPAAGVTLTTSWATSTQAAVSVQFTAAVTVATNQASYSPGQTVSITATVSSGGSPVANAGVSFTITKANGAVVTGTATTGNNGAAVYKLKLMKNDPAGTYQVGVVATINATSGSAAATALTAATAFAVL